MGQKDTAVRLYLKDPAIFADACNYALFGGENVIKPESLKEQDISQITALVAREKGDILSNIKAGEADAKSASTNKAGVENINGKEADKRKDNALDRVKRRLKKIVPDKYVDHFRDVYKEAAIMSDGKTTYALIGIEAQTNSDREMAIRIMLADALSYATQAQHIRDINRAAGKLYKKNYISGLLPGDRIRPVITLIILFSDEDWDVPRSLGELFEEYDSRLAPFIQDYHLNLIVPSEIENFDLFNSNLGLLMQIMEAVKDREKLREVLRTRQTELDELDVKAARVLGLYTDIEAGQLEKIEKEGNGESMSKYWKAFIDGEIKDGIEKGIEERMKMEVDQRVEKELDQRMEEKEKEWESERITLASENSNLTAEIMKLREQITRLQEASV